MKKEDLLKSKTRESLLETARKDRAMTSGTAFLLTKEQSSIRKEYIETFGKESYDELFKEVYAEVDSENS